MSINQRLAASASAAIVISMRLPGAASAHAGESHGPGGPVDHGIAGFLAVVVVAGAVYCLANRGSRLSAGMDDAERNGADAPG